MRTTCGGVTVLAALLLWLPPAAAQLSLTGSDWVVDAPTKIAHARNWFNDGLPAGHPDTVAVVYASSGMASLARLLAGETAFALTTPAPVAAAVLAQRPGEPRGDDVVVLASVGLSNQGHDMIVDRRRGIVRPRDLIGRRVGLLLGSSAHVAWSAFAAAEGMADAPIELVDLPPEAHAAALTEGHVDAILSWEPYASRLANGLGEHAQRFSTREVHSVNWLLITRRHLADERPAVVDRVLRAYLRAIALMDAEPTGAGLLHARMAGVDPGELSELAGQVMWRLDLGWSVLANMDTQLRWLAARTGADALPEPADYLHAAGLRRVLPDRVAIPSHLLHPTPAAARVR